MSFIKKHLKQIIPTVILILGILLSFRNFIGNNTQRILNQNQEYIEELTQQRAVSIDNLIEENLTFIESTAYLYGRHLTSPFADVAVIRDYEENSAFELLRFIDASGDDYTSRGVMANLSDRPYFQSGMRGESGITYVLSSRVTNETQIGFYAPVRFEDEVIGVMVGFYGEQFISTILEFELFGESGEGWLCDSDGTVIGTTMTSPEGEADNYFSYMLESGELDGDELERMSDAFESGQNLSFTYHAGIEMAGGYAVALSGTNWMLVRNFPVDAAQTMLTKANGEGRTLILELIGWFVTYILIMAIMGIVSQRRLRETSRDAKDITYGVEELFDGFIRIDLNEKTFQVIGGDAEAMRLPREGSYELLTRTITEHVPEERRRLELEEYLKPENLQELLRSSDRTSVRVHAPVDGRDWFTFNFTVLERERGSCTRLLAVCQDITAMHDKEEKEQRKLQNALESAEKASKAKTEFLFNMSHDLRTPMNAIIGYTELAGREGVSDEEKTDFIKKIDASGRHLLALINDILEMSRIESGKMTLDPVPTNLTRMMEEFREMFSTQMAEKRVNFTVRSDDVRDVWVLCDQNRLNRVLLNLLSNAYKFTAEGGTVTAALRQKQSRTEGEGYFELSVKDNGIGMSQEFVENLFSPFERERTSTISGIQGTGLGLSITKSIVDLMGGTIDVFTEQGKGTEFVVRLRLPILEGDPHEEASVQKKERTRSLSGLRLLLVEDNAINREIATLLLNQEGIELETAENGQIAVDMVVGSTPGYYDAVLMDVQMPVLDGYEATKKIRRIEDPALAGIPIIAMTANVFAEDVQAAKEAGMDGHIAKPLDPEAMLRTLAQILPE